jgi:hypothetical protein
MVSLSPPPSLSTLLLLSNLTPAQFHAVNQRDLEKLLTFKAKLPSHQTSHLQYYKPIAEMTVHLVTDEASSAHDRLSAVVLVSLSCNIPKDYFF